MSTPHALSTLIRCLTLAVGTLLLCLPVACSRAPAPEDDGQLRVLVSIPPLIGLVEALAPEGSEVDVLIPAGEFVHGYQLRPDDRARVGRADLVVMVGVGLEGGAASVLEGAGDRLVRFDRVAGIEDDGHDHAHDHDHDHGGTTDPHLWLDFELVPLLINELERRLGALPGVDRAALSERALALRARVRALDEEHRERLSSVRGQAIVTHHDAWSRLADRFGLRVVGVLRPVVSGEPTPAELAEARRAIESEGVRAIFVEPQMDATLATRLARNAGVRVGVLDPMGSGDWFAMMRQNLDVLVDGLGEPGAPTLPEPERTPEGP